MIVIIVKDSQCTKAVILIEVPIYLLKACTNMKLTWMINIYFKNAEDTTFVNNIEETYELYKKWLYPCGIRTKPTRHHTYA